MKRNAKKTTEKDGAKAPPVRQSPRKRPCTDKKVYQNGHTACKECCVGLNRKCWCKAAIGDVRCRPAENMLAEMNTLCKFSVYGCAEIVKFVQKHAHEESCRHAPYGCPFDGCSYRGMNTGLYEHVMDAGDGEVVSTVAYLEATTVTLHKQSTPFRVLVLQGNVRKLFLLLNGSGCGGAGEVQAAAPAGGRSLCLVCLGPRPEGNNVDIRYKMEVRGSDGGALSLLGTAPCIRDREGFEPKKFSSCRTHTGGLPLVSPSAFESVD